MGKIQFLILSMHVREGYNSRSVCLSVYLCTVDLKGCCIITEREHKLEDFNVPLFKFLSCSLEKAEKTAMRTHLWIHTHSVCTIGKALLLKSCLAAV